LVTGFQIRFWVEHGQPHSDRENCRGVLSLLGASRGNSSKDTGFFQNI
jgi:hypothetical protein